MIISTLAHDIRDFTWMGRSGLTDASDLGYRAGELPCAQIFDDACDVGFWVQGTRTRMLFVLSKELRDGEGELTGWKFTSCDPKPVAPALSVKGKFSITILND